MSRSWASPEVVDRLIAEVTAAALPGSPSKPDAASVVWKSIARQLCRGVLDDSILQRWFGTDMELPASTGRLLDGLGDLRPEVIGAAFERSAHLRLDGTTKRDAGMYYTPMDLADFVVERTITALQRGGTTPSTWKVVDPAGGAGVFPLAAARRLTTLVEAQTNTSPSAAREWVFANAVHSVDSDPLATAVARSLMIAEFGSGEAALAIERNFVTGDALLNGPRGEALALAPHPDGVDWSSAFPCAEGGFDAVVGNPPWGTVKQAIREQAAHIDPDLLKLDPRKLRSAMEGRSNVSDRSSYAAQLKAAGFGLQGKGEPELYLYFVELARTLVRAGGVVGLLIPSAMQRAAGAGALRRTMFDEGSFDEWLDFVNSKGIFAIHKMFRFSAAIWANGVADVGIGHAKFGLTSVEEARSALDQPPVQLSQSYLAAVSPGRLTVPDVRTSEQAELYARLHDAFPPLGSESEAWNVRFRRELDMTNDSDQFVNLSEAISSGWIPHIDGGWRRANGDLLRPVYEGRMVHQFDAAAKGWVSGHGRSARWDLLRRRDKAIRPQFLVPAEFAARRKVATSARAAFCDVTGHANERTILAAVVPAIAVCGNKVPTCEFDREHPDLPYMWTAIANSLVLDWIARRRVATTLNFFHWEELPFPRLDPESEVGRFLAVSARRLSNAERLNQAVDPFESAALRSAIDVAVLRLYGLDLVDAAVVFEDFPLLDRGQHELNRTVTRDTVLANLAEALGQAACKLSALGIDPGTGPDRLDERLEWHRTWAAVAYIPGERSAAQRNSA